MLRLALAALLLLLLTPPVGLQAAEVPVAKDLEALFGIVLGRPCQACTPEQEVADEEDGSGVRRYQLGPPEPDPRFALYQVRVEAASGAVLDVTGVALLPSETEARAAFVALEQAFAKSLGAPKPGDSRSSHDTELRIFRDGSGQRVLTLVLRQELLERRWVLSCNAMDRKVFAKVRKERPLR